MKRLVGLGMFAAALVVSGCGQIRDRLQPTAGISPVSMPPGLPPIQDRINGGPVPETRPSAPAVRVSGFSPGLNGKGGGEPPKVATDPAPAPSLPPLPDTKPVPMAAETIAQATASPSVPGAPGEEPEMGSEGDARQVRSDANVSKASSAPASAELAVPVGRPVGEWAARVDNDIITWNELQSEVIRRMRGIPPEQQSMPGVREMVASSVLDHLIDRSLVIQKARRNELKEPKRWEMIKKAAVDFFEQERLPALLNQHKAEDRYDLERILAERGESYQEIVDSFMMEFVYQQFLMMSVSSKVTVDLPEMRAYYFENRDHESFHRDPELTWRELVVRFANHPSREAARAKVDQALARLSRGEPFDRVARELGEGPNADQGGLWTTAPGSYAVAEVNKALAALSPGQTSAPIEGPDGIHLVLLESSRPAGRMSFEAVQDEIRDLLQAEKEAELIDDYLTELYRGAVVTTVFAEYVPRHLRKKEEAGR